MSKRITLVIVLSIVATLALAAGFLLTRKDASSTNSEDIGACAGPGGACASGLECVQRCGPPVARQDDPPLGWHCVPVGKPQICPICLASTTMIDTPAGPVNVKDVRVGQFVWTPDLDGGKTARAVGEIGNARTSATHRVTHLVLTDGRRARVSPDHPTIDGRRIGDLRVGDPYDGSEVLSKELESYGDVATYDLLPEGETGAYWADGILMGSSLK